MPFLLSAHKPAAAPEVNAFVCVLQHNYPVISLCACVLVEERGRCDGRRSPSHEFSGYLAQHYALCSYLCGLLLERLVQNLAVENLMSSARMVFPLCSHPSWTQAEKKSSFLSV